MKMSSPPGISVVIASYNAKHSIADCLYSLQNQKTQSFFEIIVIDSSTDGTGELIAEKFPGVRLYRFSERKFCGDARNIGVLKARGQIIAFTDADCIPKQDWIERITMAHRSSDLVIGGAIGNAHPRNSTSWASYFCEFSQWMPLQFPKRMVDVAGANMSYKRKVFDMFGSFLEQTYCSDTEYHWRLAAEGILPKFDPEILVLHNSLGEIGMYLNHEIFHGACFGRVRSRAKKFSALKRLVYIITAPVIALKLSAKVIKNNLANRIYLRPFLKALPLTLVGIICWTLGEVKGYATWQKP